MIWFPFPETLPPLDENDESSYLLVLSDRSICPLAAYYNGERGGFYMLGNATAAELRGVRAWTTMPKIPAELFPTEFLLRHAREGELIEE